MDNMASKIAPNTIIGKNTKIGYFSLIGFPEDSKNLIKIGECCKIGSGCNIQVRPRDSGWINKVIGECDATVLRGRIIAAL